MNRVVLILYINSFEEYDYNHEHSDTKDIETEKKARELYEKAYGLDIVKPRFNEVREKFKALNETHTSIMGSIQDL